MIILMGMWTIIIDIDSQAEAGWKVEVTEGVEGYLKQINKTMIHHE